MPLTEKEERELTQISIERVINKAIEIAGTLHDIKGVSESFQEEIMAHIQDLEDIKPIVDKLWHYERERVVKHDMK